MDEGRKEGRKGGDRLRLQMTGGGRMMVNRFSTHDQGGRGMGGGLGWLGLRSISNPFLGIDWGETDCRDRLSDE